MLCMKMSNDKEEIVMQENSKGRKKKKRLQLQFLNRNLSKPNQLF